MSMGDWEGFVRDKRRGERERERERYNDILHTLLARQC
jgi:hypothetical protein